jgi:hypothetical protein
MTSDQISAALTNRSTESRENWIQVGDAEIQTPTVEQGTGTLPYFAQQFSGGHVPRSIQ